MLRTVCFKNFVKFQEQHILDFRDDGPFIFIGENGSGKSSVLEGIRRCLASELSTSVSSSFDSSKLSYFVCHFVLNSPENEHVICGVVVLPETSGQTCPDSGKRKSPVRRESQQKRHKQNESENISNEGGESTFGAESLREISEGDGKKKEIKSYCKFALEYCGKLQDEPMYAELAEVTKTTEGEPQITIKGFTTIARSDLRNKFTDSVINQTELDTETENYFQTVFSICNTDIPSKEKTNCETILKHLSKSVVFTFPLRSVGPLQWSESSRIKNTERQKNYEEAESRCEIIKCFLEDLNETKFDKDREKKCFRQITQSESDNYDFVLNKEGRVSLEKGKYELLKTPEGILEAKTFSILMSSKNFSTIVLEEPDRGMHPQFIQGMLQNIRQYKNEKRVLLTTHNTAFVNPWTLPGCFVFRRQEKGCKVISGKSIVRAQSAEEANVKQMRLLTADHISDILFAKKVLFYEGDSEMLFLTEFKHQILAGESRINGAFAGDDDGYNKLKQNLMELTFINMHTKDNLEFCEGICKELKLKYIFLVDRDAVPLIKKKKSKQQGKKPEKQPTENLTRDEWRNDRNELLKWHIFFWLDGTIEDMLDVMSQNDQVLRDGLKTQMVTFPRSKKNKLFLNEDTTSKHVRESVKLVLSHCRPNHDLTEFIMLLKSDE